MSRSPITAHLLERNGHPVRANGGRTQTDHDGRHRAVAALAREQDAANGALLVPALEDDEFDIRWMAIKGLIVLGRDGAVPLLEELVVRPDSDRLRESARQVFGQMIGGSFGDALRPVLAALRGLADDRTLSLAAYSAVRKLRRFQRRPRS